MIHTALLLVTNQCPNPNFSSSWLPRAPFLDSLPQQGQVSQRQLLSSLIEMSWLGNLSGGSSFAESQKETERMHLYLYFHLHLHPITSLDHSTLCLQINLLHPGERAVVREHEECSLCTSGKIPNPRNVPVQRLRGAKSPNYLLRQRRLLPY